MVTFNDKCLCRTCNASESVDGNSLQFVDPTEAKGLNWRITHAVYKAAAG